MPSSYISDTPTSDGDANSDVLWVPVDEALARDAVPELTQSIIHAARKEPHFVPLPHESSKQPSSLYGIK